MHKRIVSLLVLMGIAFSSFSQDETFNVQSLPTNVGGKSELKRIFEEQLQYPAALLRDKVGGKVMLTFVVNKDSSITELNLNTCGVPELDAEAMRIFRLLKWVPALQGGEFVSAR